MSTIFLALLVTGLVLGVFAMLYGTERRVAPREEAPHQRRSEHDPAVEPSPLFNLATVAALLFATGLSGYLLLRNTGLGAGVVAGASIAVGLLALAMQSLLIARWAIPGARIDHVDERYLLQGTLGLITRGVSAERAGEVRYALEGRAYTLPARNIETGDLPAGTEVVIERIEDGVAFVEHWAQVEQRL